MGQVGRLSSASLRDRRTLGQVGVAAVPLAATAVLGWRHRWIADDGLIYFRVVDNLLRGAGPVFNPGERVEAYTGPAWVAVLTLARWVLPFSLSQIAVYAGILFATAGIALAMVGAARIWRSAGDPGFLVPFGALVLASLLPMWIWMTAGLELGLVFLWLGASCALLGRWTSRTEESMGLVAMCILGLGWVIRPEAIVTSAIVVATVVACEWRTVSWRRRLGQIGAAVAVPVLYELFRVAYFGMIVSNTAVAKEGSRASVRAGLNYLHNFVDPYQLWVAGMILVVLGFVPLLALARRSESNRTAAVVLASGVAACVGFAIVVVNGGDYLHGRLFLPSVFLLTTPVMLVPIRRCASGLALMLVWGFAAGVYFRPPELEAPIGSHGIQINFQIGATFLSGYEPWLRVPGPVSVQRTMVGLTPVEAPPPRGLARPAAAVALLGAYGRFQPDLYVIDALGLANVAASHQRLVGRGYPGHEKYFGPPWIAATMAAPGADIDLADYTVFRPGVGLYRTATPNGDHPEAVAVRAARRALDCGGLADLRAATTGPLSLSRIIANIGGSIRRTNFRYSSDPVVAERELCR